MHEPITPIRFLDGELILEYPDYQPLLLNMHDHTEHTHDSAEYDLTGLIEMDR